MGTALGGMFLVAFMAVHIQSAIELHMLLYAPAGIFLCAVRVCAPTFDPSNLFEAWARPDLQCAVGWKLKFLSLMPVQFQGFSHEILVEG